MIDTIEISLECVYRFLGVGRLPEPAILSFPDGAEERPCYWSLSRSQHQSQSRFSEWDERSLNYFDDQRWHYGYPEDRRLVYVVPNL